MTIKECYRNNLNETKYIYKNVFHSHHPQQSNIAKQVS